MIDISGIFACTYVTASAGSTCKAIFCLKFGLARIGLGYLFIDRTEHRSHHELRFKFTFLL